MNSVFTHWLRPCPIIHLWTTKPAPMSYLESHHTLWVINDWRSFIHIMHCASFQSSFVQCVVCLLSDLPEDDRRHTSRSANEYRVSYSNVTASDSQVLQCNASNAHGYIFTNVYLNVLGMLRTACPGIDFIPVEGLHRIMRSRQSLKWLTRNSTV